MSGCSALICHFGSFSAYAEPLECGNGRQGLLHSWLRRTFFMRGTGVGQATSASNAQAHLATLGFIQTAL